MGNKVEKQIHKLNRIKDKYKTKKKNQETYVYWRVEGFKTILIYLTMSKMLSTPKFYNFRIGFPIKLPNNI